MSDAIGMLKADVHNVDKKVERLAEKVDNMSATTSSALSDITTALTMIAGQGSKMEEAFRLLIQLDKRVCALERDQAGMRVELVTVKESTNAKIEEVVDVVEENEPFKAVISRVAVAAWIGVFVIIGGIIMTNLGKILSFLGRNI